MLLNLLLIFCRLTIKSIGNIVNLYCYCLSFSLLFLEDTPVHYFYEQKIGLLSAGELGLGFNIGLHILLCMLKILSCADDVSARRISFIIKLEPVLSFAVG